MEGGLRQPCFLQERYERALTEVGGVDRSAALGSEDEALILIEGTGLQLFFSLPCSLALEGVHSLRRQAHSAAAVLSLGFTESDAPAVVSTGQRPAHPDGSVLKIDVFPLKAKKLSAPHASVDGEYVKGFETISLRCFEQPPSLV